MRYFFPLLGLVALLIGLAGLKACQIGKLVRAGKDAERAGPPPEAVATALAQERTWERTLDAVASVVTAKGVVVANDAPGVVSRIRFASGESVKKDRILVELDSSVERAERRSALARLEGAEIAMTRSRVLAAEGVIPKAQFDTDEATWRSLSAEVKSLDAQIERKIVRAPFTGKLGIREVNLGQYLPSGMRVTVLESAEPDYVEFSLPQQTVDHLTLGLPVRAFRGPNEKPLVEGAITAIEPRLDSDTRSVRVRASLPGRHGLRPGMFLTVRVILPQADRVVTVPLTAVQHAPYGDSLFAVESMAAGGPSAKPRLIARQKFVRVGEARGDFVSIQSGINAGERIVVAGGFKLRNGVPVIVDETVKLDHELAPRPENR